MLRSHHHRRRSPTATQLCAAATMFLLLLSLAVLHSRLSFGNPNPDSSSTSFSDDDAENDAFGSDSDIPDPDPDPYRIPAVSFGSDDRVRNKLDSIRGVEDALMVKGPLPKGWVRWLEEKVDFLHSDRMLRSNLDPLHPKNHPFLQEPDIPGIISLTQGDLMVQEAILKEMEKVPFGGEMISITGGRSLHLEKREAKRDGRRWGYYPGIDAKASFSEFVERFFEIGKCGIRVFMVWNSLSSMYGVRHQRGLESVLRHHRDACVLMLSETMELEFFKGFVEDGYGISTKL